MKRVFFFPSVAAIFNDKIVPVILELARQGNRVDTIILSQRADHYLKEDNPYGKWLRQLTEWRPLVTKDLLSGVDKVALGVRLAFLAMQLLVSRDYLVFIDTKGLSRLTKPLFAIAKRRGHTIGFASYYNDIWKGEVDWDEVREDPEVEKRLGKVARKKQAPLTHLTKSLVYGDDMRDYHAGFTNQQHVVLPMPKMQSWWSDFVEKYPVQYVDDRMESADEWIALFLTHQGNYIFREDSDLDVLLIEMIQSIREVYPDILIVIKPKETVLLKQRDWFDGVMSKIDDDNVVVVNIPVALLASKAIAGITTGHTTAQFEFMSGDSPWVEYCRYSDFWKGIYPNCTYTEKYGGKWVQTRLELTEVLGDIQNFGLYEVNKTIKSVIGFKPQEISFDFFAK